jgi:hypothetical protein
MEWRGCNVAQETAGNNAGYQNTAKRLVALAMENAVELFHDQRDKGYIRMQVDGHHENWAIESSSFRGWLSKNAFLKSEMIPSQQALADAANMLNGAACFDGQKRSVHVRIAGASNRIYVDRGDPDWSAIEVTPDGWRVVPHAPVYFRRPKGLLPLPEPKGGEKLDFLRSLLNVGDDANWRHLIAWLLCTLHPAGPYPILVVNGEQGSAKSTLCEALRYLVDPHVTPLRAAPRKDEQLALAAHNGWLLAYDNLTSLPGWLSDALCRVSTGGAHTSRQLYTDEEESLLSVMRPVLINGIDSEMVSRNDLRDRALFLTLPAIPDRQRQTKRAVWSQLEAYRPLILGALLDAAVIGLRRLPHVKLDELPRMADSVTWVEACSPALGWAPKEYVNLYMRGREEADQQALGLWEVMPALLAILEKEPVFEGTYAELLKSLNDALDEIGALGCRSFDWPRNPRQLSSQLRRFAPILRREGVHIQELSRSNRGCRVRIAKIQAAG